MTKYRTQTANILNDADSFERRLNWEMFTFEQDQLLFGYNSEVDWVPGDYIYQNPRSYPNYFLPGALMTGVDGNFVRPMIEEFEDGVNYLPMRCRDCQVSWSIWTDICWMCGKSCGPTYSPWILDFEPIDIADGEQVPVRRTVSSSVELQAYLHADLERATAALRDMARASRELLNGWEEARQRIRPLPEHFVRVMTNSSRRAGRSLAQSLLDEMVNFASPTPEPVVIFGMEMPEGWDNPRHIPMPEMPEPPDYSGWTPGYMALEQTLVTMLRRR